MTVRHTHEEVSPGPSCFNVTTEMSLQLCSSTNNDSLQVQSLMAPKQDRAYACVRAKSVTPSVRLVISSDDEHDPEYVPPRTATLPRDARATRALPKMVASGVVATS